MGEVTRDWGIRATRRAAVLTGGLVGAVTVCGSTARAVVRAVAQPNGKDLLDAGQRSWLNRLGEVIVPGAEAAGLANYIADNLSRPASECLLALRYFDVIPPYAGFYLSAIRSLSDAYGAAPAAGDHTKNEQVLSALNSGSVPGWSGPPSQLFVAALRFDAIDVVYGTPAAFERLGIEYMPHVLPETDW